MSKTISCSDFAKLQGLTSVRQAAKIANKPEGWLYRNWSGNRALVECVVIGASIKAKSYIV